MSIVNGTGAPRLEIKKASGATVTIDLPMPELRGNKEDPAEEIVVHEAFDRTQIVDRIGFKPRFTLDYSTGLDGLDVLSLRHLLEREIDEITLTPHIDLPGRKFKVRLVKFGETFRFGTTELHSGVKMQFESTEIIDAMPFPQASLTGKRWQDMGLDTWNDHTANVWHFFR